MKVAICFWGLTRSLKHTLPSINKHIFNVLKQHNIEFDCFLHTYNLPCISNKRSNELNVKLDTEEYKRLPLSNFLITSQEEFDSTCDFTKFSKCGDPWGDGGNSIKNFIRALNSLNLVSSLWIEHSHLYDVVLYIRPDLLYGNNINIQQLQTASQNPSYIFTPSWHKFDGLNDRLAFGHPDAMKHYGQRFQYAEAFASTRKIYSEHFLAYIVKKCSLKNIDTSLVGKRMRATGKIHTTDKGLFK
jgi:hypothetical protein